MFQSGYENDPAEFQRVPTQSQMCSNWVLVKSLRWLGQVLMSPAGGSVVSHLSPNGAPKKS